MINVKRSILAIALLLVSNFPALSMDEENSNSSHIAIGQNIFKELSEEWDKSRENCFSFAQGLAQSAVEIENNPNINEEFRKQTSNTLKALSVIIPLGFAHNAIENNLIHGNYSIFSNVKATISPDFFQYIGRTYQNRTNILHSILHENGYNDLAINLLINGKFALYIPAIRTSLNNKLEEIFKNTNRANQ